MGDELENNCHSLANDCFFQLTMSKVVSIVRCTLSFSSLCSFILKHKQYKRSHLSNKRRNKRTNDSIFASQDEDAAFGNFNIDDDAHNDEEETVFD